MPTDEGTYAIGDLAGLAGTTARTIRYYVAQGLLPAPVGSGPGAHYTDGHLARLRLIRRLQRQHQPLSAIRQRLASLREEDVAALLAQDDAPAFAPGDSALDYVRSILASTSPEGAAPGAASQLAMGALPATPVAPSTPVAPARPVSLPAPGGPARLLRQLAMPRMRDAEASVAVPLAEATAPPPAADEVAVPAVPAVVAEQRSQWDRIGITPNIEIHVRRPLSRLENRRVERLITIARQVLREEQP
jgi:DNA-binding transcriptional MerR regulator